MSYGPLLVSLAGTARGGEDDWRTVLGTLMRQIHNAGTPIRPPSRRSGESQRAEARRRGVTLYRVRRDRGASIGKGPRGTRLGRPAGISASRIISDMRSVGWGGEDKAMRAAIDLQRSVLTLPVKRLSQNNDDLDSFNTTPPASWQKTEVANQDSYISYAVVTVASTSVGVHTRLWGSFTRRLPSPIGTLSDIRQSYDQGLTELHDVDYSDETIVTYEYAGVRRLVRSVGRRR